MRCNHAMVVIVRNDFARRDAAGIAKWEPSAQPTRSCMGSIVTLKNKVCVCV